MTNDTIKTKKERCIWFHMFVCAQTKIWMTDEKVLKLSGLKKQDVLVTTQQKGDALFPIMPAIATLSWMQAISR